jgi:archaellum component FlaC
MTETELNARIAELFGEMRLLRSDTKWMREEMARQSVTVKDLDERVRDLEQSLARIEAKQKPTFGWPAIVATIVSLSVAILAILDRIYN